MSRLTPAPAIFQTRSQSAVSRVSKPAISRAFPTADLEIGDTAGLETCATSALSAPAAGNRRWSLRKKGYDWILKTVNARRRDTNFTDLTQIFLTQRRSAAKPQPKQWPRKNTKNAKVKSPFLCSLHYYL
jgi:hypothetical protein